ncbi:hypothetical protein BDV25DRAFT_166265 [Aspergillus avenaceus]|uniref:Uncharacterized protein n=1 Tax=Aspergillus avenaceus TaxID=36643 RepID=A0A5N6TEE7_ASPAV|nr:hypothetical protein BDV25DRAFT_166265 [Aspergillus avenaceus]
MLVPLGDGCFLVLNDFLKRRHVFFCFAMFSLFSFISLNYSIHHCFFVPLSLIHFSLEAFKFMVFGLELTLEFSVLIMNTLNGVKSRRGSQSLEFVEESYYDLRVEALRCAWW